MYAREVLGGEIMPVHVYLTYARRDLSSSVESSAAVVVKRIFGAGASGQTTSIFSPISFFNRFSLPTTKITSCPFRTN